MSITTTDRMSIALAALSDPTRRAIVRKLANDGATLIADLGKFDMAAASVTYHLNILADAELITRTKVGNRVECKVNKRTLKSVQTWAAGLVKPTTAA